MEHIGTVGFCKEGQRSVCSCTILILFFPLVFSLYAPHHAASAFPAVFLAGISLDPISLMKMEREMDRRERLRGRGIGQYPLWHLLTTRPREVPLISFLLVYTFFSSIWAYFLDSLNTKQERKLPRIDLSIHHSSPEFPLSGPQSSSLPFLSSNTLHHPLLSPFLSPFSPRFCSNGKSTCHREIYCWFYGCLGKYTAMLPTFTLSLPLEKDSSHARNRKCINLLWWTFLLILVMTFALSVRLSFQSPIQFLPVVLASFLFHLYYSWEGHINKRTQVHWNNRQKRSQFLFHLVQHSITSLHLILTSESHIRSPIYSLWDEEDQP